MGTLNYFCNFSIVVNLFQNKNFKKKLTAISKTSEKQRVHDTKVPETILLPLISQAWPPWNLPTIIIYLISLSNGINLVVYKQKTALFFSNHSLPTYSVISPFLTSGPHLRHIS